MEKVTLRQLIELNKDYSLMRIFFMQDGMPVNIVDGHRYSELYGSYIIKNSKLTKYADWNVKSFRSIGNGFGQHIIEVFIEE